MAQFIQISKFNPVKTIPSTGSFAIDLLSNDETKVSYLQKFQFTDNFTFQFRVITGAGYVHSAKLVNELGYVWKTFYINEKQSLLQDGWTYYEINEPLSLIPEDNYYFKLKIAKTGTGTYTYYSELLSIKEVQENTILIRATNSKTKFDTNFDNIYTKRINFELRVEGQFYKDGINLYSKDVAMQDMDFNTKLIDSIPYKTKILTIGQERGVSNDIIEIVNLYLSLNTVYINDIKVTKYQQNTKLTAIIPESKFPLKAWTIELIESENNYVDSYDYETYLLLPLIQERDVDNINVNTYGTQPFKIVSLTWNGGRTGGTIVLDYDMILPPKQPVLNGATDYTQYWQIYKVGANPLSLANVIQITEDVTNTTRSFKFTLTADQIASGWSGINTALSVNAIVGFCCPSQVWQPYNLTLLATTVVGIVNLFPYYLEYDTNTGIYTALIAMNNGSVAGGFGVTQSADFKSWGNIVKITLNDTLFSSWMDTTDTETVVFYDSKNMINNGIRTIPFLQMYNDTCGLGVNTLGLYRAGISYLSSVLLDADFDNYSENYFTSKDIPNDGYTHWSGCAYAYFNDKHYIAADIRENVSLANETRRVYLFEWSGSIDNMDLDLLQIIGEKRVQYQYNYKCTEVPSFFESNGRLWLICEGLDNSVSYEYEFGNEGNVSAFYVLNEKIDFFEQIISAPGILNYKLFSDAGFNYLVGHGSVENLIEVDGILNGLVCQNAGSFNTYQIVPAVFTPILKETYKSWLESVKLLN